MGPNPVLEKLGFADDDRVVIIHADDIGMCQASLAAFAELAEFGLVSSGAVMVPCPWFLAVAEYCQDHPNIDIGVHLTLTSEWPTYRWGPISTRDPATGLMDEQGYFHRGSQAVVKMAEAEAVQVELAAQLTRALEAGIDVTHIDSHMGSVGDVKFVSGYIQMAVQSRLPALTFRLDVDGWQELGVDASTAVIAMQLMSQLEEQGFPLLDRAVQELPLDQPQNRIETAKRAFDALPPGLTHFILHPSKDTPELRAITPDWEARVADYVAFLSPELRDHVQDSGIHVIGYRALRNLLRGE
jgi:predicted glycoside hydrolase/deacetylase ChbG (UPF0249 family)